MNDIENRLFKDVRPLPPPGLKPLSPPGLKPLVMAPLKPLEGAQVAIRPVGRPTTCSPDLCTHVIEMVKHGYSKVQIACEFDVSRQTLDNWCKDHPEFLDALKGARNYLTLLNQTRGRA